MRIHEDLTAAGEPKAAMPRTFATFRREGLLWGRFGLRAAWGIAAYVAVWVVVSGIASFFAFAVTKQLTRLMQAQMQAQAHPGAPRPEAELLFTPLFVIVSDGLPLLAMLGTSWLFSLGERRPFGAYGLGKHRWRDVFQGAGWGLVIMSGLIATLHALHLLVFDGCALGLSSALAYGCKWLFSLLLVGFAEEYFFRGYLQYTLTRGMWGIGERLSPSNIHAVAFWISATLLSIVFAGMHGRNVGETNLGLFVVFLAGMTFAYALWRTGSLWWAIGFHATWDWAQSFLFGVPDSGSISVGRLFVTHASGNPLLSGGSDGPEGSAFVVLALLLALVAIRITRRGVHPKFDQTPTPDDIAQGSSAAIS